MLKKIFHFGLFRLLLLAGIWATAISVVNGSGVQIDSYRQRFGLTFSFVSPIVRALERRP